MWRSRQVAVATNSTPTIQNTITTPKGMATRTTTNTVAVAVAVAVANTMGPANTTTGNAARLDRTCMPVDHRIDRRKFRAVHRIRNDNRNHRRSRSSSSAHRNVSANTVEIYSVTSRRHRPNINSNAICWVFFYFAFNWVQFGSSSKVRVSRDYFVCRINAKIRVKLEVFAKRPRKWFTRKKKWENHCMQVNRLLPQFHIICQINTTS